VRLNLRDVTGRRFDVPFQMNKVSVHGPMLVGVPAGRVMSVAPGRYTLFNVPAARLWLPTWNRQVVVEAGKETVIDALIPEAARLTTVSVASSQGAHPVAAFLTIVAGELHVRYDFIGQDLEVILPDAHVELLVERRKRNGGMLGTFEISPAAVQSDGRIELTVDDE
jgi:hypothetical protein